MNSVRPSSPQAQRRAVKTDLVVAALLLVLGALYGIQALREGLGSVREAGAGLFPFLVAIVLVIASLIVCLQELRGDKTEVVLADEEDDEFGGEVHWWRIGGVLIAAFLVPIIGNTVGFVVTLSIVLILIAKIMGLPGWRNAILLGLVFGLAVWLIFVQWLFVPLPAGVIGLM